MVEEAGDVEEKDSPNSTSVDGLRSLMVEGGGSIWCRVVRM